MTTRRERLDSPPTSRRERLDDPPERERLDSPSYPRRFREGTVKDAAPAPDNDVAPAPALEASTSRRKVLAPRLENFLDKARTGAGRPPGSENKVPKSIKAAIRQAMELHGSDGKGGEGMAGYMLMLARDHKHLFVSLIRRTLPISLKAEVEPGSLLANLMQTAQAARSVRETNGASIVDVTPTSSWRSNGDGR